MASGPVTHRERGLWIALVTVILILFWCSIPPPFSGELLEKWAPRTADDAQVLSETVLQGTSPSLHCNNAQTAQTPIQAVETQSIHRSHRNLLNMTAKQLVDDADTTQLASCQWINSVELQDYTKATIVAMPGNHFDIYVRKGSDDIVSAAITSRGHWELPEVLNMIAKLRDVQTRWAPLQKKPTFLDIGANVGFFSFSAAASGFNVVAVEMMASNQLSLYKSICRNPTFPPLMRVIPYGLGEAKDNNTGRSECLAYSLETNSRNGIVKCGNNVNAADIPKGFSLMGTTVIVQFDELVPVVPELSQVGVVKLDTEGFEAHVVRGAYNFFKDVRPPFLMTETSNFMAIRAGSQPRELLDLLDELDYEVRNRNWDGPVVSKTPQSATALPGFTGQNWDGFEEYLFNIGPGGIEYGADIVFSPEIIDLKLIKCERIVDPVTGIITFEDTKKKEIALRIHPSERDRLVVQLGSASPDTAVKAARMLADDVSGIDLNCGCPKAFSLKGGMGAALLSDPDRLVSILTALVETVRPLPVTCKIRVFDDVEATINLVKRLETTGITALHVHCRTKKEPSSHPGRWSIFPAIVNAVSIPVIANGDVLSQEHAERVMDTTGVASVMMARAPHRNLSVFQRDGTLLPALVVAVEYLRRTLRYDFGAHNVSYIKYTLLNGDMFNSKHPLFNSIFHAKTLREICQAFQIEDEFDAMAKSA
ncbi:hypothetical protein SmJEL517_g02711 [Synchytrium microbalum]|uniref:DUS-like FMN-binding domain-containing protein n=1 Tax=Synchytrium microbalum TaxID=1806994 RepID=A0A507C9T4_9FUNG|nr:uncharacterized protein SmJEL517_g02711 [Synchytrium microbalum]TPX34734.1 hypothetical protein SmJEL517_g02711 [Synchytrium microbalum]